MASTGLRWGVIAWLPTVAFLVVLPLLVSLGFWQLQRAGEVEQAQERLEQGREAPAVDLADGLPEYEDAALRRVTARGRYMSDRQILIDNQARGGTPGYQVLTPLRLEGVDRVILVDRGWVEGDLDRSVLPEVGVTTQPVEVRGTLDRGPQTGIRIGEAVAGEEEWPLRAQYLDYDVLGRHLGASLPEYLVRLDPDEPHGYVRDWSPTWRGPERHYSYAFQWFALAAALCVIFVVVRARRR